MKSLVLDFLKSTKLLLKICLFISISLSTISIYGQEYEPTRTYKGDFTVLSIEERTIYVSEQVSPYYKDKHNRRTVSYVIDIITVRYDKTSEEYDLVYPEDGSWKIGVRYHFVFETHYGKTSKWTDEEIEDLFMDKYGYATSKGVGQYLGVITSYRKLD